MPDIESLLQRLLEHHVEFVIVGGYAAVAQGVTLVTQDMDICCRFSADNLLRLQQAVAEFHPVHRMTPTRMPLNLTSDSCRDLKNLYLSTDLGQLDCLSEIVGVGIFDEVLGQSEEVDLGFDRCRILTVSGLIQSKSAMNRPRDREALLQLKAIAERTQRPSDTKTEDG